MTAQEKYKRDGNSDEFSKKFHDRAWEIANDLNKQLLNLSTGIIAAMFFLAFDKHDKLTELANKFILLTIFLFGCTILCIILSKQWDASKNYFLGHINDSNKQTDEERKLNEYKKRHFDKKQRMAKEFARYFFLFGVLSAIVFLTIFISQ
jgi:hypothetical protein